MNSKINSNNYDLNKDKLSECAVEIYEIFQKIIPSISKNYNINVNGDEIQYSTKNGSLKDEHNGYILFEARKAFNQFVEFGIIKAFSEADLSKDIEHIVKFTIM